MIKAEGPVRVELQTALDEEVELPAQPEFEAWANKAVVASGAHVTPAACITIRVVNSRESSNLNAAYRNVSRPTNVLAFPANFAAIPGLPEAEAELGDLVICHEVVAREAREQGKNLRAHLAHMVVHGTLHLLGYDHQDDAQAAGMETLEISVLQGMGFADPYENQVND